MNEFKTLIEGLLGRRKLNIYQRVLRLALLGSLLTFAVMSGLYVYAIFTINGTLREQTIELGDTVFTYIEDEMNEQVKLRMTETTQMRSYLINLELENAVKDVQWLSDFVSMNLKHPEQHMPHTLPNALYEDVYSGTPYIFFSPELVARGVDENISREIGVASACEDLLLTMSNEYDCIVVASKNGYVIRIDKLPDENSLVPLCNEPLKSSYDSRKRDWYLQGEKISAPIFTDLYSSSTTGEPCVSILMPYHDNDGIAGVIGLDVSPNDIYKQVNASSLEGRDTIFVLGKNGEVLFSTSKDEDLTPYILDRDLRNDDDVTLAQAARRMVDGEQDIEEVDIDGNKYFLAFAPLKSIGWSFGTLIDQSKVHLVGEQVKEDVGEYVSGYSNFLESFLFKVSAASLFIVAIIFAVLFRRSLRDSAGFVEPIHSLIDGVQEVAGGNLDKKIEIHTGDEIELLADNFNHMTGELKAYMANLTKVTAAAERTKTELAVATKIQEGMLPTNFPVRDEFNLYASMTPAKAVGGDFYDFYFLDKDHFVITIADVSDKGVPAALFMVMAKTLLKDNILTSGKPENISDVMRDTNNELCDNNEADMFVTLFTAIIELSTGEMTFVNAGHNPPFVRRDKKFSSLGVAQSPIFGTLPGLKFPSKKIQLHDGDAIFLYTDGVTEAMNDKRELFGEKRLQVVLDKLSDEEAAEKILSDVNAAVKSFVGDAQQSDDITMLAFVLRG